MPTTSPSSTASSAPRLCSASVASRVVTVSEGSMVTTSAPLYRRMSEMFTAFTSLRAFLKPAAVEPDAPPHRSSRCAGECGDLVGDPRGFVERDEGPSALDLHEPGVGECVV